MHFFNEQGVSPGLVYVNPHRIITADALKLVYVGLKNDLIVRVVSPQLTKAFCVYKIG